MNWEKFLGLEAHIERSLILIGIAISAFTAIPMLHLDWQKNTISLVIYGLFILAIFQFILFFISIFPKRKNIKNKEIIKTNG